MVRMTKIGSNLRDKLGSATRAEQLQGRWSKPMPLENPHGIPREIMKTLAEENLSSDPARYNARLQELLAARKQNGG